MSAGRETVAFTRIFRTSVARLFRAWTEPAVLGRWLVPGDNTTVSVDGDPRLGGAFRIEMLDRLGRACAFAGVYTAVVRDELLAMTWRYEGPAAALAGVESVVCARFRAVDDRHAELQLEHARLDARPAVLAYRSGWESCMAKLDAVLGGEPRPDGFAYGPAHRAAQSRLDCVALADTMAVKGVRRALSDADLAFVGASDMLFLATVDDAGMPTVSYKGGAPGFVRADPGELWFPSFDGNGMCLSIGNLTSRPSVGLLFVDFQTPNRLRVQGTATIDDGPAKDAVPGAVCLIRVRPTAVFSNCARYVHRMLREDRSKYVPDARGEAPFPAWKRIDLVFDGLAPADRERARHAGPLSVDEYAALLRDGQS